MTKIQNSKPENGFGELIFFIGTDKLGTTPTTLSNVLVIEY